MGVLTAGYFDYIRYKAALHCFSQVKLFMYNTSEVLGKIYSNNRD